MARKFMGPIFGRKDKNGEDRNLWWLQGVFLALFLVVGGIFALKATYQAASKLTGGKGDADQSASGLYKGDPRAASSGFFRGEEEADNSSMPARTSMAGLTDPSAGVSSSGTSGSTSSEGTGGLKPLSASEVGSGAASPNMTGMRDFGSQSARPALAARPSGLAKMGNTSPRTGGGVSASMGAARGGMQVQVREGDASLAGANTAGRSSKSVFNALKQGAKIALMGAQSGSMDTASQWNTSVFDGGEQTNRSIDYGGKGAALDKFDPKSVPGYLREDALKLSSVDTLNVPKVGELSDNATASAADPKNKKKNKQSGMSMNGSLYGGASGILSPSSSDEEGESDTGSLDDIQSKISQQSNPGNISIMSYPDGEDLVSDEDLDGFETCEPPVTNSFTDGSYTVDDGTGCMHLCNETSCEMSCYA